MIGITGLGIICNIGMDILSIMDKLTSLTNSQADAAIGFPKYYDDNYRDDLSIVAEVPRSNNELIKLLDLQSTRLRDISRTELLSIYAIKQALDGPKCQWSKYDKSRVGIFCGTSQASTTKLEAFYTEYKKKGKITNIRPLLAGTYNVPNKTVAQYFGLSGAQSCISTACSSSLVAFYLAHSYLKTNQIDAAIVYGVDPISELVIGGFKSLQAMAEHFSSPFSRENIGMSLGEGAVAIFLEKNPTDPIAYISGIGCSTDAHHITAPHPNGAGAVSSMSQAYSNSQLDSLSCDVIYAHGSGTQANDECEVKALVKYFGQDAIKDIPVLSLKGAIGHTLGAAGLMNVALACASIERGVIPASPRFTVPRQGCSDITVNSRSILQPVSHTLINAFGFGGNNASVVLSTNATKDKLKSLELKPVYITGFGCITSVGETLEELYAHVFSHKDAPINEPPVQSFTARVNSIGASTTKSYEYKIDKKLRKLRNFRKLDRFSKIVLYSSIQALESGAIKRCKKTKEVLPVILGTGTGPMAAIHNFYDELVINGIEYGNPSLFPNNVMNGCLGFLAIEEDIKGPTILCSDHELSSVNAFRHAWILLNNPTAQYSRVLASGADEYSEILEMGYLDLMQIKTRTRDGYILGEISASFVFETENQYRESASKLYAVYCGGVSKYFNDKLSGAALNEIYISFIIESIQQYGVPDLLLFSSKNNKKHDELLLNAFATALDGIPYYTPINQFGFHQGATTALNFLLALMFFNYQRIPGSSITIEGSIQKIFVFTISQNAAISIDVLHRGIP